MEAVRWRAGKLSLGEAPLKGCCVADEEDGGGGGGGGEVVDAAPDRAFAALAEAEVVEVVEWCLEEHCCWEVSAWMCASTREASLSIVSLGDT